MSWNKLPLHLQCYPFNL